MHHGDSPAPSGSARAAAHAEHHPHGHEHQHGGDEHAHAPFDSGEEHDHDHDDGLWSKVQHLIAPHSHDAADSVDDALTASDAGIRAVKLSLIGLGATA